MNIVMEPIAKMLAVPGVADRIIERAQRTPYCHIPSSGGDDTYMGRWWVFNPYADEQNELLERGWLREQLPSIRVHHIMLPDADRYLHDHPWNARTFLLRGWYMEQREDGVRMRMEGDTLTLRHGEYHRILEVSPGGVWTLFVTGRYRGDWHFKVDGVPIPHQEYFRDREYFSRVEATRKGTA